MVIKNVIASISCLEFVNKVNSLSNELLYSSDNGYFSTNSKEAIIKRDEYIERFLHEVNKLKNETEFIDELNIISKKKQEFVENINKHYLSQIPIWADDVYSESIDNSFFELSLNKDKAVEIYSNIISALNWYSQIRELDNDKTAELRNNIDIEVKNILNQTSVGNFSGLHDKKTDYITFLKLWDILLGDFNAFIGFDLTIIQGDLSDDDCNYFSNIKNKLLSYKKDSVLDEVLLINTAANIAKFNNEEKYDFIKSVNNDFICFLEKNKTISEKEKVELIRRRLQLRKDAHNIESDYYRKLICFENL